jgi:TetR/AcrR family transcriptional regulator, regulator of cefoperazone and chloramphenicol sensitivity
MQAEEAPSKRRPAAGAKRPAGQSAGRKPPAGGGRNDEAPESSRDNISRQRVIEAAVACILEQGFYRASSNAIAERAGVSWGVIQYYFGSREALMLAVLEEGARRLDEIVQQAEITGSTVTERVAQYADILARYYGSPEYLAYTQVLINLEHDPRTSARTKETMALISESATPELTRLLRKVLAGTGIRQPAVRSLLFHALRGLSLSHVMLGTVPDREDESQHFPRERKLLAEALGLLIEAHGGHGA